jgi:hypothetical protein
LIVNWQYRNRQNITRKAAFNSRRYQESGKNIIGTVIVVVIEQKREGGFTQYCRQDTTRDSRFEYKLVVSQRAEHYEEGGI